MIWKKHGSFWEAAYMRGISLVMRLTPPWARRGKQHIAGTQRWLEDISAPRNDIMLRSAKLQRCYWSPVARHIIRQHISTLSFSRSKRNNATLFNRLLCDLLQCQRTICTPSWGHGGPVQVQLGDEGSYSYADWGQTVTLLLSPHRGAYCALALFPESKHLLKI